MSFDATIKALQDDVAKLGGRLDMVYTFAKDHANAFSTALEAYRVAATKPDEESLATAIKTRRVSMKTLRKAWLDGRVKYRQGPPAQGGKRPVILWRADLDKHFPVVAK